MCLFEVFAAEDVDVLEKGEKEKTLQPMRCFFTELSLIQFHGIAGKRNCDPGQKNDSKLLIEVSKRKGKKRRGEKAEKINFVRRNAFAGFV